MNKIELSYLRERKRALVRQRYEIFQQPAEPLRLVSVDRGVVMPPLQNGSYDSCVFEADGRLVDISIDDPEDEYIDYIAGYRVGKNNLPERHETVLFGGAFNPQWGHFLTDILSRLWPLFNRRQVKVDKIIFTVSEGSKDVLKGNELTAMKLLGVDDMIEFVATPTVFDSVLVPEVAVSPRKRFAVESLAVYDHIIDEAMKIAAVNDPSKLKSSPKKVYMSRSKLPKARKYEAGHDWLDRFYRDSGYEVIYPERMGLVEMIATLQGADEVAALTGSLPHNILFARRGTRLDLIEKYPTINNYQQGIDVLKQLDVTMIDTCAFVRAVDPGAGPFIMYPTDEFRAYAADRRLAAAPSVSNRFCRRAIAKFRHGYWRLYRHKWILPQWLEEEIGLCNEAYEDTFKVFGPWLDGRKPATFADRFSPRDNAKRILRALKPFLSRIHH